MIKIMEGNMIYVEMKKEDYYNLIQNVKEFGDVPKHRVLNPITFYFNREEVQEYLEQEKDTPSVTKAIKYIKKKYHIDIIIYKLVKNIFEYSFKNVDLEKICKHNSKETNYLKQQEDGSVICDNCKLMFNYIPLENEFSDELGKMVIKMINYIETCKAFGSDNFACINRLENTKSDILFLHSLFSKYVDAYHDPEIEKVDLKEK